MNFQITATIGCVRLIIFRNRNVQKFVTNLFSHKLLDHWSTKFINCIKFPPGLWILQYNESQNNWFFEFIPSILILEYGPSNVPLETRWDWFSTYDLLNHRAQRIYLLWQVKQKFYSRWHESPLFTVESTINLTYQMVIWSSYKPGEILSNAQWTLDNIYQVYKTIEWRFAQFYSVKTKAMHGINHKI